MEHKGLKIGIIVLVLILIGVGFAFAMKAKASNASKKQVVNKAKALKIVNIPDYCDQNNPNGVTKLGAKDDRCTQVYCIYHPEDATNCNSTTDCYNGCSSSHQGYDCNNNYDPTNCL